MLQKLKQENEEKSRKIENFEEKLSQLSKEKLILQEKLEQVQAEYGNYKSSEKTLARTTIRLSRSDVPEFASFLRTKQKRLHSYPHPFSRIILEFRCCLENQPQWFLQKSRVFRFFFEFSNDS